MLSQRTPDFQGKLLTKNIVAKSNKKKKSNHVKQEKKKKHLSLIYSDTKGYYFIHEIRTECYENGTLR